MFDQITGTVFDIRRYSIHDGPGIRTAVFFKGCSLACLWCHNPEGQIFAPELVLHPGRCIGCDSCLTTCQPNAIDIYHGVNRELCIHCGKCTLVCPTEARELVGVCQTVHQVMIEIEKDKVFFEQSGGGVTFTGGEPLDQPKFLLALLSACRVRGIHTALETSGNAPWIYLNEIRTFVDIFIYDLKLMDDRRHCELTGVSNNVVLSNLKQLLEFGHKILIRIPLIPGVNDDEANLRATGEFLASLQQIPPVELLAYHNIAEGKYSGLGRKYGLKGVGMPDFDHMQKCAAYLINFGIQVIS